MAVSAAVLCRPIPVVLLSARAHFRHSMASSKTASNDQNKEEDDLRACLLLMCARGLEDRRLL